jgi:large subunit ribosomal protein L17
MRHRLKGRKLGRTRSHRISTLRSLATALIKHKKITTTLAKAKEAKRFIEPLITKAKDNSIHSKRLVSKHIKDREAVTELFTEIAEKVGDRPGGYTRVVKLGTRLGDAAEMAILELVDFNELAQKKKKKSEPAEDKAKAVDEKAEAAAPPAEIEEAEVVEETDVKEEAKEAVDVKEEAKDKEAVDVKEKTEVKEEAKKAVDDKKETKKASEEVKTAEKKEEKAEDAKPKGTAKDVKKSEKKEDK